MVAERLWGSLSGPGSFHPVMGRAGGGLASGPRRGAVPTRSPGLGASARTCRACGRRRVSRCLVPATGAERPWDQPPRPGSRRLRSGFLVYSCLFCLFVLKKRSGGRLVLALVKHLSFLWLPQQEGSVVTARCSRVTEQTASTRRGPSASGPGGGAAVRSCRWRPFVLRCRKELRLLT